MHTSLTQEESLASWLKSKSQHTSFYNSPGAMEHTNYQLLPLTPNSGPVGQGGETPSPGNETMHATYENGSLNKVLETAQKKRNQATEALDSVTKALKPRDTGASYVRVSPGHFLLPTTTTKMPTATSTVSNNQNTQQFALGSPFSATPPSRGASRTSPSSGTRTGDVVNNLTATLKSLGGNGTPASTHVRRISALPMTTPLSPSSRLGRISSSGTTPTPIGSRGGLTSSVNFMNRSTGKNGILTTTKSPGAATSASHRLSELQKRHSELLAACHEAEFAATRAKHERKKAQADLETATSKLQLVETSLQQQQLQLEEMTAAQHAQQAQLAETTQKLTQYQTEASETALKLELTRKETEDMEEKSKQLREEWIKTQAQASALQIDTSEAQNLCQVREELHMQVDKATAHLESLLRRQSHAESAAQEAEHRYFTASAALQELETSIQQRNQELSSVEALVIEAEALLEEKEARAAQAQREWEAAEEKLGASDSALIETTARLEAKRQLVIETEQRCELLERELRCAEDYSKTAKTAAEEAEQELARILSSVEAARADESVALEEATEAETRASVACELADAEEQRAEEVAAIVADLEKRWHKVQSAEQHLLELQAEIGDAEVIQNLQIQLIDAINERDELLDELESAQEYGAVAAAEAQRAQQLGEDVEAKMQATLAQSEALILELEVKLEAAKIAETEQREARREAETLAANALAEIERLTHSHFAINEAKILEAELNETRAQLTRAANAAETAAQRATLAEKQVDSADAQLTLALVERDAALNKADALSKARDIAVAEIIELKKEASHREAAFEEMSQHQDQMESLLRTLKQERGEAHSLADALNLQVEALQDRLRAETGRRVMLEQTRSSNSNISVSRGKIDADSTAAQRSPSAENPLELEKLLAQNATLKATATRLSRALAVALQKPYSTNSKDTPNSANGAGNENSDNANKDSIPALHPAPKTSQKRRQQQPWNSVSDSLHCGANLNAVLEQLEAVEALLSSPQ